MKEEGGKEDDISESFVQFSTLVLIIHEIIIGFWRWDLWVTLYCTFRHYDPRQIASLLYHTIRKVKFLFKTSILTKSQHFHEFFTQIFFTIFLVKSKLSTAKMSKTAAFSRVFHPKIENFLGKSQLNFWTKNEDFEQCVNSDLPIELFVIRPTGLQDAC